MVFKVFFLFYCFFCFNRCDNIPSWHSTYYIEKLLIQRKVNLRICHKFWRNTIGVFLFISTFGKEKSVAFFDLVQICQLATKCIKGMNTKDNFIIPSKAKAQRIHCEKGSRQHRYGQWQIWVKKYCERICGLVHSIATKNKEGTD